MLHAGCSAAERGVTSARYEQRHEHARASIVESSSGAIDAADAGAPEPEIVFSSEYLRATELAGGSLANGDRETWRREAPEVDVVHIESSSDDTTQRALYYDSGSERAKPLLVVLHSWSATFLQNVHIPFARFAITNDWVYVQPDFRGPNRRPQATQSELAVQDVIDAVDYARAHANVDHTRVYLMGYSGGAMMALTLAGRYPDRWAGVATWVAVVDLVDWYERKRRSNSRYAREIAASCGGAPRPGSAAERECRRRSPLTWLAGAAGRSPIFIAHGMHDRLASPDHAIRAFNALASPDDRITEEQREHISSRRELPDDVERGHDEAFAAAGAPVLLDRSSNGATLVLFDGAHDMLYEPGLRWLSEQRRE